MANKKTTPLTRSDEWVILDVPSSQIFAPQSGASGVFQATGTTQFGRQLFFWCDVDCYLTRGTGSSNATIVAGGYYMPYTAKTYYPFVAHDGAESLAWNIIGAVNATVTFLFHPRSRSI